MGWSTPTGPARTPLAIREYTRHTQPCHNSISGEISDTLLVFSRNLPPWGTTDELTLPDNALEWTWKTNGILQGPGPVPANGRCLAGTCVSIPENFTEYLALNGSTANGGLWMDGDGPCP